MAQVSRKRVRRESSNSDTDDLSDVTKEPFALERNAYVASGYREPSDSAGNRRPRLESIAGNHAERQSPGNLRQEWGSGHDYHSVHASGNATIHQGDTYYYNSNENTSLGDKISASLDFPQRRSRYDDVQEKYSQTFEWVLRPRHDQQPVWDSFRDWLQNAEGIYWVSGKPGSGKSTLMKHLCKAMEDPFIVDPFTSNWRVLSFWFWEAAQEELERTLKGCLRSILWQVLQDSETKSDITNAIQQYSGYQWTTSSLSKAFDIALSILNAKDVTTFIFLDGLDESGLDREVLVDFVIKNSLFHPNLKSCVSSRHEPLFEARLAVYPKLRMQDLNGPDIDLIIKQDLLDSPEYIALCKSDRQVDELGIREIMREKAQGVMLWVLLVTRDLLRGIHNWDTAQQLEDRIDIMPAELDKLYDMLLKRNEKDSKKYRTDAAFYCQLIAHRKFDLISFSLAINDDVRTAYLNVQKDWTILHHRLQCERAKVWINARTGGLLEVRTRHESRLRLPYECSVRPRCEALTNFLDSYSGKHIDYIHRTARTYLFDSPAGRDLMTASNKTATEVERLCLETSIVRGTVLTALENKAPVGLNVIVQTLTFDSQGTECDCTSSLWNDESCESRVVIETALDALQREGVLWIEMHPTDAPTEKSNIDASFVALPAREGAKLIDHCRIYMHMKMCMLLLDYADFQPQLGKGRMTASLPFVAPSILSRDFSREPAAYLFKGEADPDYLAMTEFQEQVSLFHEVIWSLNGPPQYDQLAVPREIMFDMSFAKWLRRAEIPTTLRTVTPTMRACNSLFFMDKSRFHWRVRYTLLGGHNLQSLQPVLGSKWGIDLNSHIQKHSPGPSSGRSVIVEWPRFGPVPKIYGLKENESIRILQEASILKKGRDEAILIYCHQYGAIELTELGHLQAHSDHLDEEHNFRDIFSHFKHTELPSLYAALLHINKPKESILAFAAEEERRLALQLTDAYFQQWKTWFWGDQRRTPEDSYEQNTAVEKLEIDCRSTVALV